MLFFLKRSYQKNLQAAGENSIQPEGFDLKLMSAA
jgi:hypothetical protein